MYIPNYCKRIINFNYISIFFYKMNTIINTLKKNELNLIKFKGMYDLQTV